MLVDVSQCWSVLVNDGQCRSMLVKIYKTGIFFTLVSLILRNDILDTLATNERPYCDILVYFNLLQTKQDFGQYDLNHQHDNIYNFLGTILGTYLGTLLGRCCHVDGLNQTDQYYVDPRLI